jgi:hypothetical protein
VTTPFFDSNRDLVSFYVKPSTKGFLITDLGVLVDELHINGTYPGTDSLTGLIKSTGSTLAGDEIQLEVPDQFLGQGLLDMFNATIRVSLSVPKQPRSVGERLNTRIKAMLKTKPVQFVQNRVITGKSGLQHEFDFFVQSRNLGDVLLKTSTYGFHEETFGSFMWSAMELESLTAKLILVSDKGEPTEDQLRVLEMNKVLSMSPSRLAAELAA